MTEVGKEESILDHFTDEIADTDTQMCPQKNMFEEMEADKPCKCAGSEGDV